MLISKRGQDWYDNLRKIAHQTMKLDAWDKMELKKYLESEIKKFT